MAQHTRKAPKLRSLRAAAVLSPVRAPRARRVPSALHHAFAFFRPLIFAAVPRYCTVLQALGAVPSAERARARTAVARREPRPSERIPAALALALALGCGKAARDADMHRKYLCEYGITGRVEPAEDDRRRQLIRRACSASYSHTHFAAAPPPFELR